MRGSVHCAIMRQPDLGVVAAKPATSQRPADPRSAWQRAQACPWQRPLRVRRCGVRSQSSTGRRSPLQAPLRPAPFGSPPDPGPDPDPGPGPDPGPDPGQGPTSARVVATGQESVSCRRSPAVGLAIAGPGGSAARLRSGVAGPADGRVGCSGREGPTGQGLRRAGSNPGDGRPPAGRRVVGVSVSWRLSARRSGSHWSARDRVPVRSARATTRAGRGMEGASQWLHPALITVADTRPPCPPRPASPCLRRDRPGTRVRVRALSIRFRREPVRSGQEELTRSANRPPASGVGSSVRRVRSGGKSPGMTVVVQGTASRASVAPARSGAATAESVAGSRCRQGGTDEWLRASWTRRPRRRWTAAR